MSEPDTEGTEIPPPRTVRVPVWGGCGPFSRPEYAEVPEDVAAHWSEQVWHDKPPL